MSARAAPRFNNRTCRLRCATHAAALGVVLIAAHASAETIGFEWTAPADCPKRTEVIQRVLDLAGQPSGSRLPEDVQVSVRVDRTRDGHFIAILTNRKERASGARALRATSCEDLTRAVAAAVALVVARSHESPGVDEQSRAVAESPSTVTSGSKPAPSVAADATTGSARVPDAHAAASVVPPPAVRADATRNADEPDEMTQQPVRGSPVRVSGHVGLDGVTATGVMPALGVGAGLAGGVSMGRWSAELGAFDWIAQRATFHDPSGDYASEFEFLSASANLCGAILNGTVPVGICADAELGRLRGAATDVTTSEPRTVTWAAFGGGGFAKWRGFSKLIGVALHLDALAPVARDQFFVKIADSSQLVHRPPAVGVRARFGVELNF